ncbi:dihydroorotate dehydrogenase [Deltaproteobacteria bacterium]|nr:dihydroorotate dehydrogenase [Deltaproteobacteria bacterium]
MQTSSKLLSSTKPYHTPPRSRPVCRDVRALSIEPHVDPAGGKPALYTLRLTSPGWKSWASGQFVMIRPAKMRRPDVFWARPFSIFQDDGKELHIYFQLSGRETQEMPHLREGETVTIWGPLGNAFAVSPVGPTLILAGGIGIAPFVSYIETHPAPATLHLEFGHRLHEDCYPLARCKCAEQQGAIIHNNREYGPADLARAISIQENSIKEIASRNGLVLACGPLPFLRSVHAFASRYGAKTQLSLESRMGCGIGACLGCVVKSTVSERARSTASDTPPEFHYVQTCVKGPIFWADQIDLA